MADDKVDIPLIMVDPLWVDGIPYPGRCTAPETLAAIEDIAVYDDDVYVAGYPKSGSFWTRNIVDAILRSSNFDEFTHNEKSYELEPLEYRIGLKDHLTWNRPRIVHTHLRYHMLPKDITKAKLIHIMRNPRDVAVSYFHFSQIDPVMGCYSGSWETFFESFIAGHVAWGNWHDYMIDWMQYKDQQNTLFIQYEDLIHTPQEMIRTISAFLGKTLEDEIIDKIAEIVSFKTMKNNPHLDIMPKFLRKGVVGDWVNYFTVEQKEIIEKVYQKFSDQTGIVLKFL